MSEQSYYKEPRVSYIFKMSNGYDFFAAEKYWQQVTRKKIAKEIQHLAGHLELIERMNQEVNELKQKDIQVDVTEDSIVLTRIEQNHA